MNLVLECHLKSNLCELMYCYGLGLDVPLKPWAVLNETSEMAVCRVCDTEIRGVWYTVSPLIALPSWIKGRIEVARTWV